METNSKAIIVVSSTSDEMDSRYVNMASYTGTKGTYEIFGIKTDADPAPLVETEVFRLYVAKTPTGQLGLMKVNRPENADSLSALKREVRVLSSLQQIATQIDNETEGENKPFHGAFFPEVLEVLNPSDDKIVVFLGYHPTISTYRQMRPMSMLTATEQIDLQTGAWILGKMLKTLSFIHSLDFTVNRIDASNIMLETDVHGTFVLDFSFASEEPTDEDKRNDMIAMAQAVWNAAGGTEEFVPTLHEELMTPEQHTKFVMFLESLIAGKVDAKEAHQQAYELFDTIWPRKRKSDEDGAVLKRPFHEWITYPR